MWGILLEIVKNNNIKSESAVKEFNSVSKSVLEEITSVVNVQPRRC